MKQKKKKRIFDTIFKLVVIIASIYFATQAWLVTLDRSDCDTNSHHECSNGLHLASPNWLNRNYYGTVGLACLCNPADVVAVP